MRELRDVIAKNICDLRTEFGLTQLKLAEILNYSDKAVSKWERAESIPDIFMLKRIADHFGVTVDYLLTEDHTDSMRKDENYIRITKRNRLFISFLATALVWLIATIVFVTINIISPDSALPSWMMFIYALPTSAVVVLVFNSIWGKQKLNYLVITVLIWTLLLSIYMTILTVTKHNIWILFLVGVPAQIIILFWSGLTMRKIK